MRTLANQTKESTTNIKSLLVNLDTDVNRVITDMGTSRHQMQQVLEHIDHLTQDLDSVHESIQTVTDMNTSIASAVQEQHMVVAEINRNIHNISEISGLTSEDARGSSAAAAELGETARSLQVLIKQVTS